MGGFTPDKIAVMSVVGSPRLRALRDQRGAARAQLVPAGINRVRAAMTTFAAILALLPLALGIGARSAMQPPPAIAIISGLLLQMPLVFIVLPTLLALSDRKQTPE